MSLSLYGKLRMVHRCWRYRFKSEVPSIRYVLQGGFDGCTLLDVGANRGVYSIYMSRAAGPDGRLVSFEAQPELGAHLQAVKESFGLNNMEIVSKGLSSRAGVLRMRRLDVGGGGASFNLEARDDFEELEIPVITLDEYVEENSLGPVHFIKCDVEGHEFDVFRGGEKTLARDRPTLLFECHQAKEEEGEIFRYLSDLGYDGYFFYVSPADHANYLTKGRGKYVHHSEHANYDYVRPSVRQRNYLFVECGREPGVSL